MTYKIKSLLYLCGLVLAAVLLYAQEITSDDTIKLELAEKTHSETGFASANFLTE